MVVIISLGTLFACSSNEKETKTKQETKVQEVVPAIPSPSLPGSESSPGIKITDLTPILNWTSKGGAAFYEVGIELYSNGEYKSIYEENTNDTFITLPSDIIEDGKEYRWHVRAHNSTGISKWSDILYFHTKIEETEIETEIETEEVEDVVVEKKEEEKEEVVVLVPPSIPSPSMPGLTSSPGINIINLTPVLSWTSVNGATYYEVEISIYSNENYQLLYGVNITSTSIILPNDIIKKGEEYRWSVRAHNFDGTSKWSNKLYFYAEKEKAPPIPTPSTPGAISSPGSMVIYLNPTLSWAAVNGATYYEIKLSIYSNESYNLIYEMKITNTSIIIPSETILEGKEYNWMVRAHNSIGASDWSNILYFYTKGAVIASIDDDVIRYDEYKYYYFQELSKAVQSKNPAISTEEFLSTQYNAQTTMKEAIKQQALLGIIQNKILVTKAKKEGFSVDNEVLNEVVSNFESNFDLSANQYQMSLEEFSKAVFDLEFNKVKMYYRDFVIAQYYYDKKSDEITINDTELNNFYEENKKYFDIAKIRHILVLTEAGSDEDAIANKRQLAEDILIKVNNGEDFTVLAKEYSEDPGSKDNGGLYEIKNDGQMVPEFEDWTFSHEVGETGIIKTTYGFHIMKLDSILNSLESQKDIIIGKYGDYKFGLELQEEIDSRVYIIDIKEAFYNF